MRVLICKQYGPLDQLTVDEIDAPNATAGHVVIVVKAASLNFPDALMCQGLYQVKPPLPFVPGAEFAGIVHEVGDGVTHVKVGDRVIAQTGTGGFGEYALANELCRWCRVRNDLRHIVSRVERRCGIAAG
jgi:NADPH:quinone reductase